jgi:amino acid adenylation domain-containing protein
MVAATLKDLLIESAARNPEALAVKTPDASATYGELDALANRIARALEALGVAAGDRVGIWLDKSVAAVAAMQGILRLGAAYVPLDPLAPQQRVETILRDCSLKALISSGDRATAILTNDLAQMPCLRTSESGPGMSWTEMLALSAEPYPGRTPAEDALAYILYTSGSTGKPKGVCISNRNALAFIDWAADELQAQPSDRFASHAPFHFDLSVLDLYVAMKVGGAVFIIPDGMSYMPGRLVDFINRELITIWYSVPSVLTLMMEKGALLDQASLPLRAVLFAGEPFPIQHLRRLYERFPTPRYLNLYGPTETNVCTFYEVHELDPGRSQPVPIGKACSGDRVWALTQDGREAGVGEEGELMAAGPTVHLGYWGRPPHGDAPYATGDIVRLQADGNYEYVGRRDGMVKVRGYRVELGDIEAALGALQGVHEVAVIVHGSGVAARLVAFIVAKGESAPPLLQVKRHCAEQLPRYMIVDEVRYVESLPRTRNGKIDRLELANIRSNE